MLSSHALIGIAMVSCLISVAIFSSLLRTAVLGIGSQRVAHALLVTASACVLTAESLQARLVTLATALIALTAVPLSVQGMRQFFGEVWAVSQETRASAAAFAVSVHFTLVSLNVSVRTGIVLVLFAYARIVAGTLALRHVPHDGTRYPYRFVAVAVYLGALFHVTRVIAVVFDTPQTAFLEPLVWNVLFLGLAIVTFPCMSTGMMMLAHDQLARGMGQLINIDELTDVLTRRAFMARASVLFHDAVASGKPLSIAVLAIDQFKAVNNGFGHTMGDRILKHVTLVVSTRLEPGDLTGRLGGEELAIAVVDADKAAAAAVMDELRLVAEHSPRQGVRCIFSAGVECVMPGDMLVATLARADAALYLAREKGRNRAIIASKTHEGDVETHGVIATSKLAC